MSSMSKKEQQKTLLKSEIVELNQHLGSDIFDYEEPMPLALGVNDELKEKVGDWDEVRIQRFLARYTQRRRYKAALAKPDAKRFHIDGSEAGSVIEPHRERAEEALNPPPKPVKQPSPKAAPKARSKSDGSRERSSGKPKIMVRRKTTLAKPATASSVDEEKSKGDLKVVYKRRRIVLPPKDDNKDKD